MNTTTTTSAYLNALRNSTTTTARAFYRTTAPAAVARAALNAPDLLDNLAASAAARAARRESRFFARIDRGERHQATVNAARMEQERADRAAAVAARMAAETPEKRAARRQSVADNAATVERMHDNARAAARDAVNADRAHEYLTLSRFTVFILDRETREPLRSVSVVAGHPSNAARIVAAMDGNAAHVYRACRSDLHDPDELTAAARDVAGMVTRGMINRGRDGAKAAAAENRRAAGKQARAAVHAQQAAADMAAAADRLDYERSFVGYTDAPDVFEGTGIVWALNGVERTAGTIDGDTITPRDTSATLYSNPALRAASPSRMELATRLARECRRADTQDADAQDVVNAALLGMFAALRDGAGLLAIYAAGRTACNAYLESMGATARKSPLNASYDQCISDGGDVLDAAVELGRARLIAAGLAEADASGDGLTAAIEAARGIMTPKQRRVFELMVEGLSQREITRRMGLRQVATIRGHVAAVRRHVVNAIIAAGLDLTAHGISADEVRAAAAKYN